VSTRKQRLWIICLTGLLLFCVGLPTAVAWRARWTLAATLADAQSVTLEQFTLFGGNVVASRTLLPSDYPKLLHAFPYTLSYGVVGKMCFVPHHQVIITTRHGAIFVCRICFGCDMYSMPGVGINDMPIGWSGRLRTLFADAGISADAPKEIISAANHDDEANSESTTSR
jgi:hypothetical protein